MTVVKQSGGNYLLSNCRTISEIERAMNAILAQISNRLDRVEGLKGNPTFYKSTFDMDGVSSGQVLKASSTTQATMDTIGYSEVSGAVGDIDSGAEASVNLTNSLMSVVDLDDETVHQFNAQMVQFNSEINAFVTIEDIDDIAKLEGDVDGPSSAVDSDIVEFDGITGKLIKDGGISHAAVIASNAHQVAEDAVDGLIEGDGAGGYSAATTLSGDMLVLVYDVDNVIIHEYPLSWATLNGEVFAIE